MTVAHTEHSSGFVSCADTTGVFLKVEEENFPEEQTAAVDRCADLEVDFTMAANVMRQADEGDSNAGSGVPRLNAQRVALIESDVVACSQPRSPRLRDSRCRCSYPTLCTGNCGYRGRNGLPGLRCVQWPERPISYGAGQR